MRKLIIQIPCFNEEETLGIALDALPRSVPGFETVEWVVINDGSTDNTTGVAREHGVDHVVEHKLNRGLARAFTTGLDFCIRAGADVIVNTDADNQYNADDIPKLVLPILEGKAEIVVGERPVSEIQHWSLLKKILQKIGSFVVRVASGTRIPDAPSGFRAMTRESAMRLNVFDSYTYTLETIIQAGRKNMTITSVPIRTNPELRPSRLMRNIPSYIQQSMFTIVRIFMTYRPFRFFAIPGGLVFLSGFSVELYMLYLWFYRDTEKVFGHDELILAGIVAIILGMLLVVVGLLAEISGVNRMLLEDIRWRLREQDYREHTSKYGR
jgi:glycosyltransferase involved in cell wall biosynthesis